MSLLTQLPQLLVSGAMLALALALLALNARSRANQGFALILLLRGGARTTYTLGLESPALANPETWWALFPVFVIMLPFAALYFLSVYPEDRWGFGGARAALYTLAPGLVLVGLYALMPSLFWDLSARGSNPLGPEADAPGGPLFVFDTLFLACYALIALVLARDHATTVERHRAGSLLLVSVGFGLSAVFGCTALLTGARPVLSHNGAFLDALVTAPLLAAIVLLASTAWTMQTTARTARSPAARRSARRAFWVLPLPALTTVVVAVLPAGLAVVSQLAVLSLVWNLALPALVTYALLRHQIFGIDLTVRWTLKQSTIAGAFVAVFFVISEGAAALLSDQLGTLFGILAAGALVFLLAPLQRVAERVSSAAVPNAKQPDEMSDEERAALYRDQLAFAWADGHVDRRERERLENLRRRLELPEADAYRLEQELIGEGEPGGARAT